MTACLEQQDLCKQPATLESEIGERVGDRWGKESKDLKPFLVWVQGKNEELPQSGKSHCSKIPERENHSCVKFKVLVNHLPPSIHVMNWYVCCKRTHFLPKVG